MLEFYLKQKTNQDELKSFLDSSDELDANKVKLYELITQQSGRLQLLITIMQEGIEVDHSTLFTGYVNTYCEQQKLLAVVAGSIFALEIWLPGLNLPGTEHTDCSYLLSDESFSNVPEFAIPEIQVGAPSELYSASPIIGLQDSSFLTQEPLQPSQGSFSTQEPFQLPQGFFSTQEPSQPSQGSVAFQEPSQSSLTAYPKTFFHSVLPQILPWNSIGVSQEKEKKGEKFNQQKNPAPYAKITEDEIKLKIKKLEAIKQSRPLDEQERKELRRLKNQRSARYSRERKKERQSELEYAKEQLEAENEHLGLYHTELQAENQILHEQLNAYRLTIETALASIENKISQGLHVSENELDIQEKIKQVLLKLDLNMPLHEASEAFRI